jgi:peptide/nickel transport system substrate-binding protein
MRRLFTVTFVAAAVALAAVAGAAANVAAPESESRAAQLNLSFGFDYLDPALAYTQPSWQVLQATCLKLANFPDASAGAGSTVVPEAALRYPRVSTDRLTYRFRIRHGFRFSPPSNEPVTAASFKRAFERTLSPVMHSPARAFAHDIAGADAYMSGAAESIAGISADRNVLTVRLTQPTGDFLSRLAMPFFCAVPAGAALDPAGSILPSAGPYYVDSFDRNGLTVVKRNPNYPGPRPRFFDEFDIHANVDQAATEAQIVAGDADYALDGLPVADYAAIGAAYGPGSPASQAGHQQFFVNPNLTTRYLAMNTSRPLFASALLRQAVNYAIDRPALAATRGAYGDGVTDQILPPGMPGFRDAQVYPLGGPDFGTALALAQASGQVPATADLYTCLSDVCSAQAGIISADLATIGITVNVHQFPTSVMYAELGTRGEPFDLALAGWVADFADPFDFVNVLLGGDTIRDSGNTNLAYFADPGFDRRMADANLLVGTARTDAYASLDEDLTRAAPWAAWGNDNNRDFFSARIGCQTFQPPVGIDLAALCLR